MTIASESFTVNVLTQNVLLDKGRTKKGLIRPQDDRIGTIAATLDRFHGPLDVVGIQEAYSSKAQHNGHVLAEKTGHGPGFWLRHNEKPYLGSPTGRAGEYVGLFGAKVDHVHGIELGDQRRALLTVIGDVAFATFHLRFGYTRPVRAARQAQALRLAEALESYDNAVIFGDVNEPPLPSLAKARGVWRGHGLTSVFALTNQSCPPTSPIDAYRNIVIDGHGWRGKFLRRGWPIDDILVRGDRVRTLAAGVLDRLATEAYSLPPQEGSDHEGLWATLEIEQK